MLFFEVILTPPVWWFRWKESSLKLKSLRREHHTVHLYHTQIRKKWQNCISSRFKKFFFFCRKQPKQKIMQNWKIQRLPPEQMAIWWWELCPKNYSRSVIFKSFKCQQQSLIFAIFVSHSGASPTHNFTVCR